MVKYSIPAGFIPIKYRNPNRKWIAEIFGVTFVNKPPRLEIFIGDRLISSFITDNAEDERIAVVYSILNGVLWGNQQMFAKVWGVHKNTITNYMSAYINFGYKGLLKEHYKPKELQPDRRGKVMPSVEPNIQLSIDDIVDTKDEVAPIDMNSESEDNELECNVVRSRPETDMKTEDIKQETPYGGTLLYAPYINDLYKNVKPTAEEIDKKHNSKKVFGLWNIILSLIVYFLIGVMNPESIKSIRRKSIGALFGLKNSPCCKTMRSGLNLLTTANFPEIFNKGLFESYIKIGYVKLGTMYFDGHFVPYYGSKKAYKGYSTQRRLAMRGHYQNFLTDRSGKPVLFYVNNSFVRFKDSLLAAVDEILSFMDECDTKEDLIFIFDREGYDAQLLSELDKRKVGFIMWRKNHKDIDVSLFNDVLEYINTNSNKVTKYKSFKSKVNIPKYRDDVEAITVLDEITGIQSTMINNLEYVNITSKTDSQKVELLDGRWNIENFFKQAKVATDIDHQMGYAFEDNSSVGEDATYMVLNPDYAALEHHITMLEKSLEKNKDKLKITMHKYSNLKKKCTLESYLKQKGNKQIRMKNITLKGQITKSKNKLEQIPEKIKFCDYHEYADCHDVLKTQRSSVLLGIKVSIYNIKKQFENDCSKFFGDKRELSKFVLALTSSPATIIIKGDYWYVTLKKLETNSYQKAAEAFLQYINKKECYTLDGSGKKIIYQF